MGEPRNQVVQVRHFGDADGLEVVDNPLPMAGRGEVRVRVLASGLEYTDVVIRRHLYPQTMRRGPPFVLGYDVVGEIDQLGDGVSGYQLGDRVADTDGPRLERCPSDAPGQRPDLRAGGRRRGGGGRADLASGPSACDARLLHPRPQHKPRGCTCPARTMTVVACIVPASKFRHYQDVARPAT